mgnify:CR=1 FL=1
MGGITGSSKEPKKTQKEIVREQQRMIKQSIRTLDREIKNMDKLEGKTLKDIQKLAKSGNHAPAKTLAKTVAQIRSQRNNYYQMNAQMQTISMQL